MALLRLAAITLLLVLVACDSSRLVFTPTQVMLRISSTDASLRERVKTLRASASIREGEGWRTPVVVSIPKDQLSWPVDLPVFPRNEADMGSSFEVVIEALDGDLVLAQTRARSAFSRGRRLLLQLTLSVCPKHEPGFACSPFECVGDLCLVCSPEGDCVPQKAAIDPNGLPDQPGPSETSLEAGIAAVESQVDASLDASENEAPDATALPADAGQAFPSEAGSDAQATVPTVCGPGLQSDGKGGCSNPNDCMPGACSNGSCVDGLDTFTCNCNTGFTGTDTQQCTKTNYCPKDACAPGGTCVDQLAWSCQCRPGYTGSGTQACRNVDDCPAACSLPRGTCQDGIQTFQCNCEPGFSGPTCQTDVCSPNPCLNGGMCSRTGTLCKCAAGFSGVHCEIPCFANASGTPGATSSLTLNGRSYTLHIGSTVQVGRPSPLVVAYHGLNMTPALVENMMLMDPLADQEGFIVARPLGVGSSGGWDLSGSSDFDLTKAVIEDVHGRACVDRKRIFAAGFSHGAFMAYAVGCKLGDSIAAIAAHSGSGSTGGCVARAVPVYAFHGDADPIVSYSSGQAAVNSWVTHNACTGAPTNYTVGTFPCQRWASCAPGSEVKFCTVPGAGHTYMRAATSEFWTFFKQHPLP